MKLKDIIKNVDKSEKNSSYVSMDDFSRELEIYSYIDKDPTRITCYSFLEWYCTDSSVGGRVYFLDDEPIAYTWQSGRKSSEDFHWLSKEKYLETKKYILSLISEEENFNNCSFASPEDLEEDWDIGFKIDYSSQLMTNKIFYVPSQAYVTVVETYHSYEQISQWGYVKVKFENGDIETIKMSDVLVPYKIIQ